MDDREVRGHVGVVEEALAAVEALDDPAARTAAMDAVAALIRLYGEGFARITRVAAGRGSDVLDALAADELVSHLLVLHGVHPQSLEERIDRALKEVRPYLRSHGGDVELIGVEDSVARLRFFGSCDGCPASAVTLKSAIEQAVRKAAPELESVLAENVTPPPPRGLVQLEAAGVRRGVA